MPKQSEPAPKYLYHYTTKTAAKQIASSGYIKASTGPNNTAIGKGGYFTSKPPQTSTQNLLRNNYDGAASQHRSSDTNAYVRIPANKVAAIDGRSQLNRDVYLLAPRSRPARAARRAGTAPRERASTHSADSAMYRCSADPLLGRPSPCPGQLVGTRRRDH
jgi:hypothetical protein